MPALRRTRCNKKDTEELFILLVHAPGDAGPIPVAGDRAATEPRSVTKQATRSRESIDSTRRTAHACIIGKQGDYFLHRQARAGGHAHDLKRL